MSEKQKTIIDFTEGENNEKISLCIKGRVFELSIPEAFILNHELVNAIDSGSRSIGLFTDFANYQVGWTYRPVATKIESVCLE